MSDSDDDVFYVGKVHIDPAVWRTAVPLIVLERCDSPQLLCTWIALRWLTALYPNERGFSRAEIARRGYMSARRVTYQSVNGDPAWVDALIERGLLQDAGTEFIPGLNPRRCYTLPLHDLEAASIDLLPTVLFAYGAAPVAPKPGNENAALWRPDLPLAVLDGCDNPHMIATWLALRWLHAVHPGRASFTSIEVSRRANINQKYIYGKCTDGNLGWADRLIAKGLLRDDGKEISRANVNPRRRTIVPVVELEAASQAMLLNVLRAWNIDAQPPIVLSPNQLALDLDAVASDAPVTQTPPETREPTAQDQTPAVAPTPRDADTVIARATMIPPPPPAAHGWKQIVASPAVLWENARDHVAKTDMFQLAGLAGDHDQSTHGHGWWYVAQAILVAASAERFDLRGSRRALKYIEGILDEWRKQDYRETTSRGNDHEQGQPARLQAISRGASVEQRAAADCAAAPPAAANPYKSVSFEDDDTA